MPFRDTAVEGFESAAAARAFASLPERWQLVLWHTEVEGQKPAEVAPLLGMTANSVSALAYRAREGLRQAYLSMHAQDVDEDACARTRAALGGYVRGGLSRRDGARVEQHLEECRRCAAIYLELTEVNSRLGALLAPLLLGAAGRGVPRHRGRRRRRRRPARRPCCSTAPATRSSARPDRRGGRRRGLGSGGRAARHPQPGPARTEPAGQRARP